MAGQDSHDEMIVFDGLTVANWERSVFGDMQAGNIAGEDALGDGTDFTQGHDPLFFDRITMDKGCARRLAEFVRA